MRLDNMRRNRSSEAAPGGSRCGLAEQRRDRAEIPRMDPSSALRPADRYEESRKVAWRADV